MKALISFLFPRPLNVAGYSVIILLFRIAFGLLLLRHGIEKVMDFDKLAQTFPDPIGLGSETSLVLAIFAELVCSLFFMIGCLYRLFLLPLIFNFMVITFVVMEHAPFSGKELPFIYLMVYIILFISGPGKYATDYVIMKKINGSL